MVIRDLLTRVRGLRRRLRRWVVVIGLHVDGRRQLELCRRCVIRLLTLVNRCLISRISLLNLNLTWIRNVSLLVLMTLIGFISGLVGNAGRLYGMIRCRRCLLKLELKLKALLMERILGIGTCMVIRLFICLLTLIWILGFCLLGNLIGWKLERICTNIGLVYICLHWLMNLRKIRLRLIRITLLRCEVGNLIDRFVNLK